MATYDVYNYTTRGRTIFQVDNPFTGEFGEAFEQFHQYYSPDLIAPHPDKPPKLITSTLRVCRFCHRSYPEVKFSKKAHVLPQLIGNKHLINDSECDLCNRKFGDYEDSFAKFLGIMRTADAIHGQENLPTFKSTDGKLVLRWESNDTGGRTLVIQDEGNGFEQIVDNSVILKGTKPSYVPLHVMKCLYKIGYSFLNTTELPAYTPTLRVLTSTDWDTKLSNLCQIAKFSLPVILEKPLVVIYKKKDEFKSEPMPTKVVTLHFGRWVYQYFLLNADDTFMFKAGEDCTFLYGPPFFEGDQNKVQLSRIDLSSPFKKVGEPDYVQLNLTSPLLKRG